jgi:hypothetical protein
VLLAVAENLTGPLASRSAPAPAGLLSGHIDVKVEAAAGDDLEAVAAVVAFLRQHSTDGEALWAFPAASGLLFAAGRVNAGPHDYWYPSRLDHEEEARVLATLRDANPRLVVTLNRGWHFFRGAPGYFTQIRDYIASGYRLALRAGRYDVLARRDVADANPSWPVATRSPRMKEGLAARDAAAEPNLERRRQAAWRWMDVVTPADAAAAELPGDRRAAVLVLRALRDGGDMRGAAWVLEGFESTDARIRGEAVDAMVAMASALEDERHRFANDFDPALWRPFVEPLAGRVVPLGAFEELRPFAAAVRELASAR